MSKLTLHLQSVPAWVPQFVEVGKVEWLKWIDPPQDKPPWCDGVKVVGRTYHPDDSSFIWNGAQGARDWFNHWQSFYLSRTWVHCWEAPNEPQPMSDPQYRALLNEFTVELARLMHGAGLLLVGMNWSVGWPDVGTAHEMGEGVEACDYLGLHEYSAPAMWDGESWYCLRYRRTVAELEAAGYRVPPILVTECGIDGGVVGQPKTGWRTFTDWAGYLEQLQWYSKELDRDNVRAATIFTVCDWDWHDFDIEEAQAMSLANWLAIDEPEPPPDRARGIDVSQWQESIDWAQVAASGIEFCFIRASVGVDVDPYWETNYAGAKAAGLLVGAYHYLDPVLTGQARVFARAVAGKELELGCWADIEHDDLTAVKCSTFFEYADPQIEQPIHIYTSKSKFDKYGLPSWANGRLLWVADYRDVSEPALPLTWADEGWEFWQHTSDGAVPGIVGRVDLDVFSGTSQELQEKYGEPEVPDVAIRVFDINGTQRDWDWVVQEFGDLDLRLADAVEVDGTMQVVRLVEVREEIGPSSCTIKLLNLDGAPVQGITIAWYWPGAPVIPPTPEVTSRWEEVADLGVTDAAGTVGPSMSVDGYYDPRYQIGPYGAWVLAPGHPSDGLFGLGMIAGTEHRHLNPTFQVVIVGDEPPTPPTPEDEALERIADACERIADVLENWS